MTASCKNLTLYSYECCPSTYKILITAKYSGINITLDPNFIHGETNKTCCFKKRFPFGKIPALDGPDGPIYESNAICTYLASSGSSKEVLLGSTAYENALVMQYMCIAENEFMPPVRSWVAPLFGFMQYSPEVSAKAQSDSLAALSILNEILLTKTFLVGEQVTMADICIACVLYPLFRHMLDEEARRPYTNVTRWFLTCLAQPEFADFAFDLCTVPMVYTPQMSCKQACTKQKISCQKKCDKSECSTSSCSEPSAITCTKPVNPTLNQNKDEDEIVEAKPEKNALDLLPPSPFVLDAWKRFYSNNDTIPTAVNYFWDNFDPKGYSMYRLTYKYPSDLTRVFMSSNLIGGFIQRLDHLRKYAFGSMCVFGTDNDNEISGMFIIRGPEIPEMLIDVPDYESYHVERVDPNDQAVRAEWQSYLAWEGNFKKPFADGKIFK